MGNTAKLTFKHSAKGFEKTVDIKVGESVLDAALNFDIPLQHACGGFCACTTCHIKVTSGAEAVSAQEDDEADRILQVANLAPNSRLGCQTKAAVAGSSITVEIQNWDGL
ncbi:MAG: 2Fe-2S iron-sulfur cluster binding domain-containing protein [Bdellovibrionales bacterium]|nr:2Fe-2S iron-sulfur cluster binding domain-containing protein [Bdellovibrionales bacterium]